MSLARSAASLSDSLPAGSKPLPHSTEAEKAVLGAVLLNDDFLPSIAEIIGPEDFYHPAHLLFLKRA